MIKFDSNPSFILLVCVFYITFTTASHRDNDNFARTNNNDLQTCLSSSLRYYQHVLFIHVSTLTNQNSFQYQL